MGGLSHLLHNQFSLFIFFLLLNFEANKKWAIIMDCHVKTTLKFKTFSHRTMTKTLSLTVHFHCFQQKKKKRTFRSEQTNIQRIYYCLVQSFIIVVKTYKANKQIK